MGILHTIMTNLNSLNGAEAHGHGTSLVRLTHGRLTRCGRHRRFGLSGLGIGVLLRRPVASSFELVS